MNTAPKPGGWSVNGLRFDGIRFFDEPEYHPAFIEVAFNQEEEDAALVEIVDDREGPTLLGGDKFSEQKARDVMLLALIIARVSNPAGEIP